MVDKTEHSNQLVVNTVDIEASPDEVFELLATEAGRDAWLEPDPGRTIAVESEAPPTDSESGRIAWWWWSGDDAPRHVELWVVATPPGSRVIAIESAPAMPLTLLARAAVATARARAVAFAFA